MTTTYRAAVVVNPGDESAIEFVDPPRPDLSAGQVRLAVAAAAVNPVDLAVRSGVFHRVGAIHQTAHVGLGWDVAGSVLEAGPGVGLAAGTLVAGLVGGVDRDFGTYASEVVLPAADVAAVPAGLDPVAAATVPLNGLTAVQLLGLLGDPRPGGERLLVTGAAGAVGGYLVRLAAEAGWSVTGLARASDTEFVRGQGADPITDPLGTWDVVADAAAMQERGLALVRDGGRFVGVQPAFPVPPERGVEVSAVAVEPDGVALAGLLARTASGELPARVADVLSLDHAADAHRRLARGGLRGRLVLRP